MGGLGPPAPEKKLPKKSAEKIAEKYLLILCLKIDHSSFLVGRMNLMMHRLRTSAFKIDHLPFLRRRMTIMMHILRTSTLKIDHLPFLLRRMNIMMHRLRDSSSKIDDKLILRCLNYEKSDFIYTKIQRGRDPDFIYTKSWRGRDPEFIYTNFIYKKHFPAARA